MHYAEMGTTKVSRTASGGGFITESEKESRHSCTEWTAQLYLCLTDESTETQTNSLNKFFLALLDVIKNLTTNKRLPSPERLKMKMSLNIH